MSKFSGFFCGATSGLFLASAAFLASTLAVHAPSSVAL
jgi:hypothetical protein